MSSAPNSRGRSFAFRLNLWFAATVTVLALALFFAAYLLLSASIAQKDREIIRAQIDLYRSWYEDGGITGLSQHFSQHARSLSHWDPAQPQTGIAAASWAVGVDQTGFPLKRVAQRVEPAFRGFFEALLVEMHAVVAVFCA